MTTEPSKMLVTFLLDRSSSMSLIKPATIEAFNAYVSQLKEDYERDGGIPIEMTLLQFDWMAGLSIDKTYFQTPIEKVPLLSNETFKPRGSTPLIDASLTTIEALEKAIEQMTDKPKVVVCIQTDGEENTSKRSWSELKEKITQKMAEGWAFNFMGAGIDAYDQGQKMGIGVGNTISYDSSDLGATRAAFAASATNAGTFRTGASLDTSYNLSQKMAAGDAYDPSLNSGNKPSVSPFPGMPMTGIIGWAPQPASPGLDLTGGAIATVAPLDLSQPTKTEEKGLDLTSQ